MLCINDEGGNDIIGDFGPDADIVSLDKSESPKSSSPEVNATQVKEIVMEGIMGLEIMGEVTIEAQLILEDITIMV